MMLPVFRFLQLLCENHNRDLQNFMRAQSNKNSYNLVSETPMFLDCICGSTTGELGLLGLYIKSTTSPSSTKPWKHWRYCHGRWSRLSSPFRKCANIWPTTQKCASLTRRSATTKDQKWPHFSKVSTTRLTRWNGRRNYKDSHSSFGSARACPSGVKSSSTWP